VRATPATCPQACMVISTTVKFVNEFQFGEPSQDAVKMKMWLKIRRKRRINTNLQ